MDYIWTLAFILGSFYFILKDWQLIGGVCLGLAIGCRITSGAMLIPASLMLFHQCGKLDLQRFLKLLLPALLIGICSYIPAALTYGSAFFSFVDTYPSIPEVIYEASIIVWGIIGSLAILFSVIALLLDGHFKKSVSIPGEKLLIISWVAGLLIYVIAFLRLPHDGAYLIPAVPFIILLLHRFLKRRYFISICLAIILSSFILNFEKTGFYLSGPIIRDYKARQATNTLVEQITLLNDAPKEKRVIVSGWFLPMIEANLDSDKNGLTKYVNLLTSSELQDYRNRGYEIYYLSEIREYNLQVFNIDLDKEGGKILRVPGKN